MKTPSRLPESCEDRSRVYRWLSMAFLYPEPERVRVLKTIRPEAVDAAGRAAGAKLRERLGAIPVPDATTSPSEHAAAFGHTVAKECPPYETCYGNSHVFMQAHELADIAGFYRAWGLEVSDLAKERLDHVSVELEFMGYLGFKEAHAARQRAEEKARLCRQAQAQFLGEHLARWAPAFTGLLEPSGGFYGALAGALREWVAWDCRRLGARALALRPVDLRPADPGEGGCGLGAGCGAAEAGITEVNG